MGSPAGAEGLWIGRDYEMKAGRSLLMGGRRFDGGWRANETVGDGVVLAQFLFRLAFSCRGSNGGQA